MFVVSFRDATVSGTTCMVTKLLCATYEAQHIHIRSLRNIPDSSVSVGE